MAAARTAARNATKCAAWLLLVNACSNGETPASSTNEPRFAPEISDTTLLVDLTEEELQSVCDARDALALSSGSLEALKEYGCRLTGVLYAQSLEPQTVAAAREACQQVYDPCLNKPVNDMPGPCPTVDASCGATIADLEACVEASSESFEELAQSVPECDALTLEQLADYEEGEPQPTPEPCTAYEEKCPDGP